MHDMCAATPSPRAHRFVCQEFCCQRQLSSRPYRGHFFNMAVTRFAFDPLTSSLVFLFRRRAVSLILLHVLPSLSSSIRAVPSSWDSPWFSTSISRLMFPHNIVIILTSFNVNCPCVIRKCFPCLVPSQYLLTYCLCLFSSSVLLFASFFTIRRTSLCSEGIPFLSLHLLWCCSCVPACAFACCCN